MDITTRKKNLLVMTGAEKKPQDLKQEKDHQILEQLLERRNLQVEHLLHQKDMLQVHLVLLLQCLKQILILKEATMELQVDAMVMQTVVQEADGLVE